MYTLRLTHPIEASLEDVFAFFSNPANLARITPPSLNFRIHGQAPSEIVEGARIEYRIRWLIFRLRWVTRITRWRPPTDFQDVQERGPYKSWTHTHVFTRRGNAVVMEDRVDYELPFGWLGRAAHALVVRRQLEDIFAYRQSAIAILFQLPPRPAPR
jgi:hypothetical protein